MTDLRKAAEMALEALESFKYAQNPIVPQAIHVLRQALAQPEQEPVAWKDKTYGNLHNQNFGNSIPLYTAPPSKPWVGLTDEECDEIWGECLGVFDCLKMTEAKLKEKNA